MPESPNVREGQALALRFRGRYLHRSRGTGSRATGIGDKEPLSHRRAGACPPPCLSRRTFARDRPSRYGFAVRFEGSRGTGPRATVLRFGLSREGQALALRFRGRYLHRSRGTGPRATVLRFGLNREGQALALR